VSTRGEDLIQRAVIEEIAADSRKLIELSDRRPDLKQHLEELSGLVKSLRASAAEERGAPDRAREETTDRDRLAVAGALQRSLDHRSSGRVRPWSSLFVG
jgi:hypothetical protein